MKRLVFAATALLLMFAAAPTARADEIDDAVAMFTADDGLTAAEKMPALRALIEAHKGHPKVGKLTAILKKLAAEAGEKVETATSAALTPGTTGVPPVDGGASVTSRPTTGTTGVPPVAGGVKRDVPVAASSLPQVRLYTVAEADEAQKRLGRPLRPRRKRTLSLALPVAEDGFFDNLTSRSAIINVRETIRDLVGPLEGEEEKIFNKKWDAVIDYPASNIVAWLKKVAPIASEMVRIKAFVDANVIEWSDVYDEANLARTFGAFEEAENLMAEAADIADALDAAKVRMAELQAKLENLGEMPDPIKEKAAARKRHKEAAETVRKAFGEKPSKGPEALEALCGIYMTGRYLTVGNPGVRAHVSDFMAKDKYFYSCGYAHPLWRSDVLTIEMVSYDTDTELALLKFGSRYRIVYTNQDFNVEYAFGKLDDDGGLILYQPIEGNPVRTVDECEKDARVKYSAVSIRPEDGGMCLRGHFLTKNKNEGVDSWFITRRYRKVGTLGNGKTIGHKDSSKEDEKLISQWKKNWSLYAKAYEYMCDRYFEGAGDVKVEELPIADNMYRVLEKVEFCFRDPPYAKSDYRLSGNKREGSEGCGDSYRRRAILEAEKGGELNSLHGDSCGAHEDWATAFEFARNHLAYRYHGSINGWVKRGSNGQWKRLSHYADNNASFTGRWLPPKPVSRPWEPVRMAVHLLNAIQPAESVDPPRPVGLQVGFLHYVSVKREKGDKYDSFKYFYGKDNQKTHCLDGWLKNIVSGAAVVGERTPPNWIYPETFAVVTIGFHGAKGFHGTWGPEFVPDDPRSAPERGGVRLVYHFRIKYMSKGEADALAKDLGEKYFAEAAKDWGDNLKIPDEFNLADYSAVEPRQAANEPAAEMAEAGEEKKPPTKEEIAAEKEAQKERIEFHKENIKFIEGTISRLKGELAKEEDASRRSAIEWSIRCQESNKIYEQDRIRAEETGEFHASRTPFDEMCRQQVFESAIREVQTEDYLLHERKKVYAFLNRTGPHAPSDEEKEAIWRKLDAMDTKDAVAAGQELHKISSNLLGRDVESTMNRVYTLEDKELMYADLLLRAERTKTACDIALALGGIAISGGVAAGELAPTVLTKFTVLRYSYAIGCGYIESGPSGILKSVITTYSDAVDIIWSGVDGYREGAKTGHPWIGALKGAGWSFALNKGLPWVMGKVNWRKQITFGKAPKMAEPKIQLDALASGKVVDADGPKASGKSAKTDGPNASGKSAKTDGPKMQDSPDVAAYKAEVKKAQADIEDLRAALSKIDNLDAADLASGKITDKQIRVLRRAVVNATAKVNANPTAKAILKYDADYQATGSRFVTELDRIHNEAVIPDFYREMEAKGFSPETIAAIRNKSSGKSVGMDSDFGLVEPKDLKDLKIMRNGKRVSAYVWMNEAQITWNAKYKNVTGQRADLSWENITTHAHPEAYRNKGILEIDTKNDPDALSKMNDLLDHMSLSDAQQISDVTLFKADNMLNGNDFPRLVYVREAARGTAKDMGSKFLPALDSKIKPLEKLELSLTKQGRALSKAQQHELNRLRAAREHYGSIYDTLDKIGRGEMDPSKWDDAINSLAGGQGIRQMIVDMGDLFKFLAL